MTEDRLKGWEEAQRLYPIKPKQKCEICKEAKAVEHHHKDNNPHNNHRLNIVICCRKCHMELDGRLRKLAEQSKDALKARYGEFITQCNICKKEVKPGKSRNGRCKTCASYWDRNGKERPFGDQDGRAKYKGDKNPSSKLTEDQVREIKSLLHKETNAALAREYNVSWPTIDKIRKNLRWSYVK